MKMLFHPYFRLKVKVSSVLSLHFLLIWGGVVGLYHGLYFIINLTERLPIKIERVFPYGYVFLGIFGGCLLTFKLYRILKDFSHYLENSFELGFRWFNTLDQFHQSNQVPFNLAEEIFSGISWGVVWRKLTPQSNLIILGLGGWLIYPLLALILPNQHTRFTDNFQTLWYYQEPSLIMEYPEYVLKGESYRLTFHGEYREALFKGGGQKWQLKSGESLVITNVINSFQIEYQLSMGRISKTGLLPVNVILPPEITAQTFTIQRPYEQKPYIQEGVYNLITDIRSQVQLLLTYQDNQTLVAHEVKALIPGTDAPISITPKVNISTPHQLSIKLRLRRETLLTIRVQNSYGQWSKESLFTLNIRKNQPPTVTITEPSPFINLDHPQAVTISFLAKDDISLRDIMLRHKIISPKKRNIPQKILRSQPTTSPTTLWVSNFNLPLNNLSAPSGSRILYYLRVRDLEGGLGYSSTNEIKINTAAEIYSQSLEGGEYLREGLHDRREDFNNLERDYEKLKILSETKKIDNQDIKNFQENVKEFSEKMQDDIANIEELKKDNYENKEIISENFRNKLLELKKSLESLDKDYLQKMNQKFQSIINNVGENINPEEINQFLQSLDLKEMENRVEQTLNFIENLKQLQKIDALEQLSQNLYLRYKDLESYIIANLVIQEQIRQESASIMEGLEFIKKEFSQIIPELPNSQRIQLLKNSIINELTEEKIFAFDRLAENSQDDNFLKNRSDHLDQLRRSLARLNSQNQSLNQEELLADINFQIISLNRKIEWLERLENGREYDLPALEDKKKFELITQLLSKYKTLFYNFREKIFLLSSAATLELDFMEHYDSAINKIENIQRKISPDQQQPNKKKILNLVESLLIVKHTTLILSRELILLKNILNKMQENQQQNMGLNRAIEMQRNLNQRIQKMLQRGNLTEREKQYLKNMALEQNLLRSLMEEVGRQQLQSRQSQQEGKGQNQSQEQGGNQGESLDKGSSPENNQNGNQGKEGNHSENNNKKIEVGKNNQDNNPQKKQNESEKTKQEKVNKKRREIIEKMKQLERELLRDNPDLAKIEELQKSIEDNLFRETQGLQGKDKEDNTERFAEKEDVDYRNNQDDQVFKQEAIKKDERVTSEKLKNRYLNAPRDFQARIRRFIELNSFR